MNDKTTALITAGNAMAERLRQYSFVSDLSDDWDAAILDIESDSELAYLLGKMEGRQENFSEHLKALIEKDPKRVVASDASYAYGYLEACDKTFEVRDLARASILHYNELLKIAQDLAMGFAFVMLGGAKDDPLVTRANDAAARLTALEAAAD